jgi:hypothetical protein
MKNKRITIEVEIDDKEEVRLEYFVKEWIKDNFWNNKEVKLKIEDVTIEVI